MNKFVGQLTINNIELNHEHSYLVSLKSFKEGYAHLVTLTRSN